MIEAAADLKRSHNIDPANVEKIEIGVRDTLLKMCNIQEPVTGLEGKFSMRFTAAMSLLGENTALIANYNEDKVQSAEIVALRESRGDDVHFHEGRAGAHGSDRHGYSGNGLGSPMVAVVDKIP